MLKEINGYDGIYSVSDEGYVQNNITGRVLKPDMHTTGKRVKGRKVFYLRITLSIRNIQERFSLSRLVATYYLENPENKAEVNHIDGDRTNNNVNNLEWVTTRENVDHAMSTGLCPKGEDHGNAKYTEDQAKLVILLSRSDYSRKDVADISGTTVSFVKDIRCGRAWKHLFR